MIRKAIILFLLVNTVVGLSQNIPSHTFIGEKRNYFIKYGWFKVGKVELSSSERFIYEKEKRYFDVKIKAGTAGLGGVFTDFKGNFSTKIDAETLLPVASFRKMKSNESDNRRTDYYKFSPNDVYIKTVRHKNNKIYERTIPYKTMYDVSTAILQCRTRDFSKAKPNQSLGTINVFWNKTVYPVSAKYIAKEEMRHKGKKIGVYKVHLFLPESGFIKDKKPVIVWLSADGRNVPVQFEAKTRYGSVKCELADKLD